MKLLVTALVVPLLASCWILDRDRGKKEPEDMYAMSPQGYWYYYADQGTVSSGRATLSQILKWHGEAIDRGVLYLSGKYGWDRAQLYNVAKANAHILVDNCAFQSAGSSAVWAAGQWLPRPDDSKIPQLITCLYKRVEGPTSTIPADSPDWTRRIDPTNPNNARWGVLSSPETFSAMGHEMGHAWTKDPGFEH